MRKIGSISITLAALVVLLGIPTLFASAGPTAPGVVNLVTGIEPVSTEFAALADKLAKMPVDQMAMYLNEN